MKKTILEPYANGIQRQWELKNVLLEATTSYQHIIIAETEQGISLFSNGQRQSTEYSQRVYHEGQIVPALLLANKINNVLIIGSSEGVVSQLAVQAGATNVIHVDIDRECVDACAKYLPYGYSPEDVRAALKGDQIIHLKIEDGFSYVEKAIRNKDKFDLIVMDLTDEQAGESGESAQQNRLYQTDFMKKISELLSPEGVFITLAGCPNLWRNETLKTSWKRAQSVFPTVVYFEMEEHNWSWILGTNMPVPNCREKMISGLKGLKFVPEHIDEVSIAKAIVPPISLRRGSL